MAVKLGQPHIVTHLSSCMAHGLIRQRTVIYPGTTRSKIYPQNTIQIIP